jgi:hypothetical protein
MLPAVARDEGSTNGPESTIPAAARVMSESAAVKLQAFMRGTV